MKFVLLPSFSVVAAIVAVGLLSSGNSVNVTAAPSVAESDECDNPFIDPVFGICEPECYCIPDSEPCDECPGLGDRVIPTSPQGFQDAAFFLELEVANPKTLFTFDPPGCQPYPLVAQALGGVQPIPVCEGLIQESSSSSRSTKKNKKSKKDDGHLQCSFDYKGRICESNRYNLVQESTDVASDKKMKRTKKNKSGKSSPLFVTHEGSCGVCSTAQDLAINLSPTLDQDAFLCTSGLTQAFISGDPQQIAQAFPTLIECYGQQKIGFSPDCAFIWASNSFNTFISVSTAATEFPTPPFIPQSCVDCAATCLQDPTVPQCVFPITPGTCELSSCFSCDEDASGALFVKYGGRTRRNSGIVTTFQNPTIPGTPFVGTKRPCSTIADVKQPSRTC